MGPSQEEQGVGVEAAAGEAAAAAAAPPAAGAHTPEGFKSWGANPLFGRGAAATPAPAFGMRGLRAALADKEQRAPD